MDRSAFYDILENPELSGPQEKALEQLTKEYPWFGLGQILYTKALHKNEDSRFDDQLLLASVYSYDREYLFEVVNTNYAGASLVEEQLETKKQEVEEKEQQDLLPSIRDASSAGDKETIEEVKPIESKENPDQRESAKENLRESAGSSTTAQGPLETIEEVQELESKENPDQRESAEENLHESAGPSTTAQGPLESIEEVQELESKENPDQCESAKENLRESAGPSTTAQGPLETIEEVQELESKENPDQRESAEENLRESAGQNETIEEVQEPNTETDYAGASSVENRLLQQQILTGAVSRVIEKEVEETHFELAGEIDEDAQAPIKKVEIDENYSPMTAWLLNRANEMKYEVEVTTKIPSKNLESEEFRLDQSQKIVLDKKSKSSLLDAFIKKDAKISKGKATEYESGDRAADSLKDSDDFLTETMAMIYAKQGKIAKAKKAYKKLSLIYPEKSIYFAARIKELDKK